MKAKEIKLSRFEVRISEQDKSTLERASQLSGYKNIASFVTAVLKKKSQKVIEKHERILVSDRDKEIFFDAILSTPEPNERLKRAAQAYGAMK